MYRKMLFCVLALMFGLAGWARAGDITSNLEGYWRLNEGLGQWAYDSSGMGKDAVLGHDEQVAADDPTWFVPDWGGYALYFDGNSFLRLPPLFNLGTGEISVMWFVQQTDPTGWQYILANKADFTDYFFRLGFNQNDGRLRIYTEEGGNVHIAAVTDQSFTGEWLWGCVTRKGDVGTLYIDGEFRENFSTQAGDLGHGDSNWWIGCNGAEDSSERFRGYLDEIRVYSRALTAEDVATLWEGFKGSYDFASPIYPEDEQDDVSPMEVSLAWNPGEGAISHDVYVGTTFEDVNNATTTDSAIYKGNQTETTFVLEDLPLETTTYWRIDEHQAGVADASKGQVWSFTTEAVTYEVATVSITASSSDQIDPNNMYDPTNLINGAGLNEDGQHDVDALNMWQTTITGPNKPQIQCAFDMPYKLQQMRVWNHNSEVEFILGFGIKEALIEYSLDGLTWTELKTVELAQATGLPDYAGEVVPLDIFAQFVRITANSNFSNGETYGLSELRFDAIPTFAREMTPEDGTTLSGLEVDLGWRNSRIADEHKVYLDVEANLDSVQASDPASLATTFAAQGSYDSYTAGSLNLGETYVWKVVEVNEALTPAEYSSSIQSFTTPDYLVFDDMESFDDANLPWMTWADGYDVAGNGSLVGTDPANNDFTAETGVVNSGNQSLPIWIDNTTASYSEATRTLDPAEDWSAVGITALSLFVQGIDTTGGSLYAKINGNKVPLVDGSTYPAGYDPGWVQYVVDLTGMNVSSVTSVAIGVEGANAAGVIYVDDMRLYAEAPELTTMTLIGSVIEAESGTLTGPWEIRDDPNCSGGQYIIVPNGTGNGPNENPVAQEDGWAVYTFDVPADGDYIVAVRGLNEVAGNDDDGVWFRIPGAIINDPVLRGDSGFLRHNNLFDGPQGSIVWDFVRDDWSGGPDPTVFTLTAGQHEFQISHREDGTGIDAIAIFAIN
jgi:hypothetical protein